MISATCPCGGTYETDVGYRDDNRVNVDSWLDRHQNCVNVRAVAEEMAVRKSTKMTFDWASGFRFIDNANVNYDNYQFHPTGNVECRECGYAQAKGSPPQHAIDCPFA